jgi:hypothetical protein
MTEPSARRSIGIGSPQSRWRENSQSRSLYMVLAAPAFRAARYWVMAGLASATVMPLRKPEFTITPSPSCAVPSCAGPLSTTGITGKLCATANAWSRLSCAGTAMIAPVP